MRRRSPKSRKRICLPDQGGGRRAGNQKGFGRDPRDRIATELEKQFKELRQQAAIPGFRIGHAPAEADRKAISQT